ncbi:MAG: carbon-nitrogen hydrolase family protein [Bryobacterales bacterium]|nr:carbon-nitrogen hydrolase family protein [Bryobacterales bacterium]
MSFPDSNPPGFPGIAHPDARVLVANAYAALRGQPPDPADTSQSVTLEATETGEFLSLLKHNPRIHPLRLPNHPEIQARLGRPTYPNLRLRALLRAASLYVSDALRRESRWITQPVQSTGGERFWLVPESKGLFRLEIARKLPKDDDEIAPTLRSCHKGLEIIPEKIATWTIAKSPHRLDYADTLLRDRTRGGNLRIAVCPMTRDACFSIRTLDGFPADQPRFILESIDNEPPQLDMLDRVLRQAHDEGISILVLPELRMPPALLRRLSRFLNDQTHADLRAGKGILAVAAGSWHIPNQPDQGWLNRMSIYNHRGMPILQHDKLAPYTHPEHGLEGIDPGTTLQFLETSIGRIAGAICVGFFHKPLEQLLIASRAEIFLVPAMSPRTTDLIARAGELVRSQRASTFVAACATVGNTPEGASFYRTPLAKQPTLHHSGDLLTFHFQFTDPHGPPPGNEV